MISSPTIPRRPTTRSTCRSGLGLPLAEPLGLVLVDLLPMLDLDLEGLLPLCNVGLIGLWSLSLGLDLPKPLPCDKGLD